MESSSLENSWAFVRIESAVANRRGEHPGIFAMLRGLRESGRLSDKDAAAARELVDRSYALHNEPAGHYFATDPPAVSWFRIDSSDAVRSLMTLAGDIFALLARYDIVCREVRCVDPGRITYEDDRQVVAVPFGYATDWPFLGADS